VFIQPIVSPSEANAQEKWASAIRLYRIFDGPAPLAGSQLPLHFDNWRYLRDEGFRHVVCLCSENPKYDPSPLQLSITVELDDLAERLRPFKPVQEAKRIGEIAKWVVDRLERGEGVIVHCAAGRGRTGTIIGATLRILGHPAEQIIDHLDQIHWLRNGKEWPEAEWQADLLRKIS
jgi:Predicted protein-tyrosine phosphatase